MRVAPGCREASQARARMEMRSVQYGLAKCWGRVETCWGVGGHISAVGGEQGTKVSCLGDWNQRFPQAKSNQSNIGSSLFVILDANHTLSLGISGSVKIFYRL